MTAYYNEIDPFTAAWLRELIKVGVIAPGEVDERDIREVQPDDLRGFTQCHFFAGIGVWSYALRAAGWPDDTAVWTGSCPCQSFSASGKRGGFSDQRHLWPAWFRLIRELRPGTIFGEQVASSDGLAWLDVVSSDLEGAGYALGAADLCAAGFGAPHIRQRLYFVADSSGCGTERLPTEGQIHLSDPDGSSEAGRLADAQAAELSGHNTEEGRPVRHGATAELGNAVRQRRQQEYRSASSDETTDGRERRHRSEPNGNHIIASPGENRELGESQITSPGFTNGFWADAQWLYCRDGKYRPVKPGTFPLAHGSPNRVGRLRGYGNALCAPQAEAFIRAYMDSCLGRAD